jgi:hypothetical protein
MKRLIPLVEQLIDQPSRRVFGGQSAPAKKKSFSVQAPHRYHQERPPGCHTTKHSETFSMTRDFINAQLEKDEVQTFPVFSKASMNQLFDN